MEPLNVAALDERINRLERRVRVFQAGCALAMVALAAACLVFKARPVQADEAAQVLRVRGLIIEDEQGRPRILLGAPVPKVSGRKRQDDATGLIILGEHGADRVAVAYPTPEPQIRGRISKRIGPDAGIVFDDPEGNERGGFGAFDDGSVVLGLDYPDREGVSLVVAPRLGFSGIIINAEHGSPSERAELGVLQDGTSLLKLADTNGTERVMLIVQDESPAKLLGLTPKDETEADVGISWLNPNTSKHVMVKSGRTFMDEIAKLKP